MFPTIKTRRNNDPKLLTPFKKFTQVKIADFYADGSRMTCANITRHIDDSFYESVSAPYLLARLVAAGFVPEVVGIDGYKTTFDFMLKHNATGRVLTLYDYKGGSSFGTEFTSLDDVPKDFLKDVKAVIKALSNDRFPHPYDGCVIGEIA